MVTQISYFATMEIYTLIKNRKEQLLKEKSRLEESLEPLANVEAELAFIAKIEPTDTPVVNEHLNALESLIK